jgi:anti-anti-sigma regulatory factor
MSQPQPFAVTQPARGAVIVTCGEFVDHPRDRIAEQMCERWVDDNELVVLDVSKSIEIITPWLKLFARLSARARATGKRLVLVGLRDDVRESADYMGLGDAFSEAPTVAEALR